MRKHGRQDSGPPSPAAAPRRLERAVWAAALWFSFFIACPGPAPAGEPIAPGESLSLERCIDIALERHPGLLGAQGELKASRSRVDQAKSGYYPQVSASSGYSRSRTPDTDDRKGSTGSSVDSSVDLSQTLYDFGRTSTQVEVQSLGAQASQGDLREAARQVVFGVKQAYYGIITAQQARDAAGEAIRQLDLHLDQARRFYQTGLKPKIDVTNAEVNLGQARLDLLNAENVLRLARNSLNNTMGVPGAPAFEVRDDAPHREYAVDLDSALQKAYAQRPDLQSARSRQDAAARSVELERTGYYPRLSGNAGYGWSGEDDPLEEGWSVGASLDFPLFSGFLTRSRVEEAKGNLDTARANEQLVRQNIRLEVEQAFSTLKVAREKIGLAELTLRQARENRDLAQGRYNSGVGSSIEVADAVMNEITARKSGIFALFEYRLAVASLEKALGENR